MAVAGTETLLSLDQYAELLGIPPCHFNQAVCALYPDDGGCRSVWWQYPWMSPGKASREELARCIAQAERMIAQLMSTWPAPKWIAEDVQPYPKTRYSLDIRSHKVIGTRWRNFIAGGRRAVALIAANVAITYPVDLATGWATVSTAYAGSAVADEVAVFASTDTSPAKQMRHMLVTIAGGTLTIRGRTSQFLLPALWEGETVVDGDDSTQYLTTVNIYRVYNSAVDNAEAPIEFGWHVCDDTSPFMGYGVLQVRDARQGLVLPMMATWDDTAQAWSLDAYCSRPASEPDTMQLFYKAGWPLDPQGRVSEPVARAIAALATALLSSPVCGCSQAEKMSIWWQSYPSKEEPTTYRQLEAPWGPKRGAFEAYRVLSTFWGGAGGIGL